MDRNFVLEPNLKRLAAIKIADVIWSRKDIKMLLIQHVYMHSDDQLFSTKGLETATCSLIWYKFVQSQVTDYLKLLSIPSKSLKTELQDIVLAIGEKIMAWTHYIIQDLKLDITYIEEIFWTPFGTIDESGIFNYWLNNKWLSQIKSKGSLKPHTMFYLACLSVEENYVSANKNIMIAAIEKKLIAINDGNLVPAKNFREDKKNIPDCRNIIISSYLAFYINDTLTYYGSHLEDNINPKAVSNLRRFIAAGFNICNSDMLQLCVALGLSKPMQYFFKKCIDSNDKIESKLFLQDIALLALKYSYHFQMIKHKRGEYTEVLFFILNKMRTEEKLEFINEYHYMMLKVTMETWPYQDFCFPMCDAMWPKLLPETVRDIFLDIAKKCRFEQHIIKSVKRNVDRKILEYFWSKTPNSIQVMMVLSNKFFAFFMETQDFSTLSLFFKEEYFQPYFLNSYMVRINEVLEKWLKEENFELIVKFYKETFVPQEDRVDLVKKLQKKLVLYCLGLKDFRLLDKFLKYLSANMENPFLKSDIDVMKTMDLLIHSFKYYLSREFFNWYPVTSQEQNNIMNRLREGEVSRKRIFDLWLRIGVDNATETDVWGHINLITSWIFNINGSLDVKRAWKFLNEKILQDEMAVIEFCLRVDAAKKPDKFPTIDDFMNRCNIPFPKRSVLKTNLISNFEKCMAVYSSNCKSYQAADALLIWLLKGNPQVNRSQLIKRFMNTPGGVELVNKILHQEEIYDLEEKEDLLKFMNKWVRLSDDIEKLKKDIIALNAKKLECDDIAKISLMFDKLKNKQLKKAEVFYLAYATEKIGEVVRNLDTQLVNKNLVSVDLETYFDTVVNIKEKIGKGH